MGPINTGPEGCWKAAFVLAILGIISFFYLLVKGGIWLFNHIKIEF